MPVPLLASTHRDGLTLRFHDSGAGNPPLVFVHGWGCSHLHFAPQLRHFSVKHRVVAPDQRGHDASDAPHDPIGIDMLAFDAGPALRSVAAPVLLIDPPRTVGDRAKLRAALPALSEEIVPGVGHFLQLEAPEAVNAALERFAARCA